MFSAAAYTNLFSSWCSNTGLTPNNLLWLRAPKCGVWHGEPLTSGKVRLASREVRSWRCLAWKITRTGGLFVLLTGGQCTATGKVKTGRLKKTDTSLDWSISDSIFVVVAFTNVRRRVWVMQDKHFTTKGLKNTSLRHVKALHGQVSTWRKFPRKTFILVSQHFPRRLFWRWKWKKSNGWHVLSSTVMLRSLNFHDWQQNHSRGIYEDLSGAGNEYSSRFLSSYSTLNVPSTWINDF